MHSLRHAACRLLASPAPTPLYVKPRFAALPNTHRLTSHRRTFFQSRHVGEGGKSLFNSGGAATTSTTPVTATSTNTASATSSAIPTPSPEVEGGIQIDSKAEDVQEGTSQQEIITETSSRTATDGTTIKLVAEVQAEMVQDGHSREPNTPEPTSTVATSNVAGNLKIEKEGRVQEVVQSTDLAGTASTMSKAEVRDEPNDNFDFDVSLLREAAEQDAKAKRRLRKIDPIPPNETIFIGNLFYDVTVDNLKSQFSKYGVVESARIIYDTRGISKGFAYVQLDSIIAAERAIKAMHLQVFQGRRVTVYYAMTSLIRTDKQWKPSDTIYVGNMPFDTTDRELQQLAASLQNVIDVRVNMDRRTGQFRGFIHIQFLNVESAMVALEKLANPELHGRKLKVLYTHKRKDRDARQEARES